MKENDICPICGKRIANILPLQGTITRTFIASDTYTSTGNGTGFVELTDICFGHTTLTSSTTAPVRSKPVREPVPDAFLDAFEDDDEWTL